MARFRGAPVQFPSPPDAYDRENEAQFRTAVNSAIQDSAANVTSLVDADTLDGHDSTYFRSTTNVDFTGEGAAAFDDGLTIGGSTIEDIISFNTYFEAMQFGISTHGLLYSNGSAPQIVANGTSGQYLKANGTSQPTWNTLATADVSDLLSGSHTWDLSQIFTAAASFQSGTVPFVVVGTDRVDNLNAEKWDSLGRGTTGQVVLAVTADAPVWGQVADAHVLGAAAIAWSKISKSGSSLADLGTRSAADLSSGSLADARLSANVPLLNVANTFTGTIFVPALVIDKPAGTDRRLLIRTAGVDRWWVGAGTGAELGANAGTDFYVRSHTDAGASINNVVAITRSSGLVTLSNGLTVAGAVTAQNNFAHTGSNLGFYNHAVAARSAAYTQTYATADRTHAARTAAASLTDSVGGTVATTLAAIPDPADTPVTADFLRDDLVANVLPGIRNAISSLISQLNKVNADHLDTAQLANVVVDDLQANGMFQ